MTRTPAVRALVAAVITLVGGLALSLVALLLGLIGRVSWLAAVVVPLAVGATVYVRARRGAASG
jgi:hypothetical protein